MTRTQVDAAATDVASGAREVVVGVNDSEHAVRVTAHALREAVTTHRPLRVVHAWTTPVWTGDLSGMSTAMIAPKSESTRIATGVATDALQSARHGQPELEAVPCAIEGAPGPALVRLAEEAGLLVVGGRGHGSVVNALLGSATLHALHHAQCAVMVVPTAVPAQVHHTRIVIGMDFSTCSESALRWGLDAGRRHGCPVVVVHVRPSDDSVSADSDHDAWLQGEVSRALRGREHVQVSTAVVHGHATERLLEIAGPEDLLVVGSRGHGGFAGLMLGSTAAQVAQHTRSVVTVVRAGCERLVVADT